MEGERIFLMLRVLSTVIHPILRKKHAKSVESTHIKHITNLHLKCLEKPHFGVEHEGNFLGKIFSNYHKQWSPSNHSNNT